jgi:hypothetical protein
VQMLHDPAVRNAIETRLKALRPDAQRQWGTMTPAQMVWHLNQFLLFALGEGGGAHERPNIPIPAPIMRFLLLHMPWPKGARTNPKARATGSYDFAAERERCLKLIDRFVSLPLDGPWPVDATWGEVKGPFASKIQAKHFDHHLRQFNA